MSRAFGVKTYRRDDLEVGGDFAYRLRGEEHVWTPETISTMQHAVRSGDYEMFKKYTAIVNDQTTKLKNLRGLFELELRTRADSAR